MDWRRLWNIQCDTNYSLFAVRMPRRQTACKRLAWLGSECGRKLRQMLTRGLTKVGLQVRKCDPEK
jgi:hypothetical protein